MRVLECIDVRGYPDTVYKFIQFSDILFGKYLSHGRYIEDLENCHALLKCHLAGSLLIKVLGVLGLPPVIEEQPIKYCFILAYTLTTSSQRQNS